MHARLDGTTYVKVGAGGPNTTLETDDGGLADLAGADEVGVYVSLPRHGCGVWRRLCIEERSGELGCGDEDRRGDWIREGG